MFLSDKLKPILTQRKSFEDVTVDAYTVSIKWIKSQVDESDTDIRIYKGLFQKVNNAWNLVIRENPNKTLLKKDAFKEIVKHLEETEGEFKGIF